MVLKGARVNLLRKTKDSKNYMKHSNLIQSSQRYAMFARSTLPSLACIARAVSAVAQPLYTVTDLEPVSGAGWNISTASAINNLGQIVGLGVHNGQNRAYLLTPIQ